MRLEVWWGRLRRDYLQSRLLCPVITDQSDQCNNNNNTLTTDCRNRITHWEKAEGEIFKHFCGLLMLSLGTGHYWWAVTATVADFKCILKICFWVEEIEITYIYNPVSLVGVQQSNCLISAENSWHGRLVKVKVARVWGANIVLLSWI